MHIFDVIYFLYGLYQWHRQHPSVVYLFERPYCQTYHSNLTYYPFVVHHLILKIKSKPNQINCDSRGIFYGNAIHINKFINIGLTFITLNWQLLFCSYYSHGKFTQKETRKSCPIDQYELNPQSWLFSIQFNSIYDEFHMHPLIMCMHLIEF